MLGDSEQLKFKNYSKRYFPHPDDLRKYLVDYPHHYDLNIKYDTRIVNIHKEHELFVVADDQGNMFTAHWLVVATGVTKAYYPDIPGVELCDTYADHSISPEEYRDMRVLVVGKGNYGFETAENLTETAAVIHVLSPHSLKFAWETHFVGNLRAVNNNLLDTYQLKSQNTVIDASITKIEKMDDKYYVHIVYSHAKGQSKILVYDRVILCTGFRFDDSIFDVSCRPQLNFNGKFPEQTHEWESVNVPHNQDHTDAHRLRLHHPQKR